jgi:DNA-binding transcriptional ArsR family regulator
MASRTGTAAAADSAALFAALAAESRVRILQLLASDALCVGALSRGTGITPGAVSQHLRVLRAANLVSPERRGYFIHYRLSPDASRRLSEALRGVLAAGTKTSEKCACGRRAGRSGAAASSRRAAAHSGGSV